MRLILGSMLSIGVIMFSLNWVALLYYEKTPSPWLISLGLGLVSLVLLKSALEEINMWLKERKVKKENNQMALDLHRRMSDETAKLYAKIKEDETNKTTSLKDVLGGEGVKEEENEETEKKVSEAN